eukprot:24678-Amphidinium_carterae.1
MQLALYRHPWHVTRQQLAHDELDNVSGADNLCYWRCLQGMLAGEGHSDAFLPPEQLKQHVLGYAIENVERLAATFRGLPETYEQAFRHDLGANNMASDKSVMASSDYYGLNITVLFSEEQAAWHYVPPNQPITHPSHLIWLEAQHYQRGPLKDLGAAVRHALPVAGGSDQRFRGGQQLAAAQDATTTGVETSTPIQRRYTLEVRQIPVEEAHASLRFTIVYYPRAKAGENLGLTFSSRAVDPS